jgi:hypothetical protein
MLTQLSLNKDLSSCVPILISILSHLGTTTLLEENEI